MSVLSYWLMGGALTAGLTLFGAIISLGYSWYRDVVREQLETFRAEGEELLRIAQLEPERGPLPEAEQWNRRVKDYLASAMGQTFVHRFSDSSRLPVGLSTLQSDAHHILEFGLRIRIARIERLLSELEWSLSPRPLSKFAHTTPAALVRSLSPRNRTTDPVRGSGPAAP
jgi:hypothetical protein